MVNHPGMLMFVGTYTRSVPHAKTASAEGVYSYRFDPDTGSLTRLGVTRVFDNPSFLAIHPSREFLYVVAEVEEWPEGLLSAYRIERETGVLHYLNVQSTRGSVPAHVSVDRTGKFAIVANYMGGAGESVTLLPINADGSLAPASSSVRHHGTGPNPARQEMPHPHSAFIDPSNRFACVPDLGIDRVMIYRLDFEGLQLVPNEKPGPALQPGSGPRHLAFHPNGRFAYVIQELSSAISALAFDSASGDLALIQSVSALPEGYANISYCADIHVHPGGKYLYGSNRGHDSIVVFAIDETTGAMNYVSHHSTGGRTPRNFAIDPTGNFLLAANQDSDTIVTFRIDPQSGRLEETGHVARIPAPVCLKMLAP